MNEILTFLKDCGTFYLATTEDNQPHVRPFGAVCEYESKLYFVTANTKKVYAQLIHNPKIEICGMANEEWLRLEAEAVIHSPHEAKVAMLDAYPSLGRMYSADDDIMALFYIKNAKASISSFGKKPKEYTF